MRIIILIGLLFFCISSRANDAVLNYDGIGVIKFGMKLQDVESLIKEKAITEGEYSPVECNYVTFNLYKDVAFMVEGNIILRADVGESIKNSLNVKIGQTLEEVKVNFPAANIKENFYDKEAHDIYLKNPKGKGAIIMYESEGKIKSVRAGVEPHVSYVEGCL